MFPQRRISFFASPSTCLCSTRKEIGWHPESKALSITFGLSAIKIPFSGSARFRSCTSEILAYISSSWALKSVISIILDMIFSPVLSSCFHPAIVTESLCKRKPGVICFHLALLLLVKQFVYIQILISIHRIISPITSSLQYSFRIS